MARQQSPPPPYRGTTPEDYGAEAVLFEVVQTEGSKKGEPEHWITWQVLLHRSVAIGSGKHIKPLPPSATSAAAGELAYRVTTVDTPVRRLVEGAHVGHIIDDRTAEMLIGEGGTPGEAIDRALAYMDEWRARLEALRTPGRPRGK